MKGIFYLYQQHQMLAHLVSLIESWIESHCVVVKWRTAPVVEGRDMMVDSVKLVASYMSLARRVKGILNECCSWYAVSTGATVYQVRLLFCCWGRCDRHLHTVSDKRLESKHVGW
ncbi:hypothetical protein VFPPC_17596 [Pochonia chlamydosporia 170]|uniref:Uncharacterized protein n=1 Tax=Pochonia chlamydosporia 170 TaxID=1380566 RepID=A0A219AR51_METCM|nr:hypothetical protein VFPPC_17596 [Pochonia chlamydosporia 170]OWT43241.1 hypothetical protein VFPPC_17596 [Pochonia chlamydosporia 170]